MEANALPLFHDLEQTQGPFGANASTENTRVVQTRVQEIHANETAAVVGISCSVTFGQADLGVTPLPAQTVASASSPFVFCAIQTFRAA